MGLAPTIHLQAHDNVSTAKLAKFVKQSSKFIRCIEKTVAHNDSMFRTEDVRFNVTQFRIVSSNSFCIANHLKS